MCEEEERDVGLEQETLFGFPQEPHLVHSVHVDKRRDKFFCQAEEEEDDMRFYVLYVRL